MPRLKHKTTAVILGVICITLISIHWYRNIGSAEFYATETIHKAVGWRNSSSSLLVLPEESTLLLQPAKTCEADGHDVFALFIVITSPENRERRNVIRTGWSSVINNDLDNNTGYNKMLFFTGIIQNDQIPVDLEQEWREEGDLIVEDLMDSYLNLTLKVLRMLKWKQSHCPLATYLVKIDDDVHLNMLKFLNYLKNFSGQETHNLIAGHVYNEINVIRDPTSKWFVPKDLYAPSKFPKFVSGVCYILGVDAVPKIYQASLLQPLFHLEDVFLTGMIANDILNMKLSHIPSFAIYWSPVYNLITSSCTLYNKYIGVHSVSLENLKCWNYFNKKDFICDSWPVFLHCY